MTRNEVQSRVAYWADQYGVPSTLALAVAQRESGFNQDARGGNGEIGVMQLKPATAAGLGVDPYDADSNIEGGVKYLSQMYGMFGDWGTALSGYNAGPGATASAGGIAPKSAGYVASVLSQAGMLAGGAPPDVGTYQPAVEGESLLPAEWGENAPVFLLAGAAALFLLLD